MSTMTAPVMDERGCEHIRTLVTEGWCQPLRDAEVEHHVLLLEGFKLVRVRRGGFRHVAVPDELQLSLLRRRDNCKDPQRQRA